MKKITAIVIHFISPKYFIDCDYKTLDKWGVEDIFDGKILWIK